MSPKKKKKKEKENRRKKYNENLRKIQIFTFLRIIFFFSQNAFVVIIEKN